MSTTWDTQEKSGTDSPGGWEFNDANLMFNSANDPDTGEPVYFNGIGSTVTFTNQTKS